MALTLTSKVKLNDGRLMPRFGFGVYEVNGDACVQAVMAALKAGYRLIDSAEWYENEQESGQAINAFMKESGVPRSEIFYTTKIMTNSTYEHACKTIDASLKLAGLSYIDLYLVHSPYPNKKARLETWRALEDAVQQGKVKSIGVSNYGIRHLEELYAMPGLRIKPAVNQLDLHPFMRRIKDVEYNRKQGIVLEAWGPLARAYRFNHPTMVEVAKKHSKTTPQVFLRWGLQQGFVVIPKSVKAERIQSNADVFDFELDEEDMKALDGLDEHLVTDCKSCYCQMYLFSANMFHFQGT